MSEQKFETLVYEDLGFPIQLINVPLRKVFGEWVLDINLTKLQLQVLKSLIQKPVPLQKGEIRFIRKYFEMTTKTFGEIFGVTHPAVIKWENGQLPSPPMDVCIRMYVMERLNAKDSEFGKLFHKISMAKLAEAKKKNVLVKPLALHIRKRKNNQKNPD